MSKAASSASWSKVATILLPIVAVFTAGFLVFLQWNRLRSLQEQRIKTEHDLVVVDQIAQEIKTRPEVRKKAVVPRDINEQSLFLDMIRNFANKSQVHLVRYTNRVVPPPPSDSAEAKKSGLPPGVTTLTSDVEVSGDYNGVRQFLYQLLHSPRLYNITDPKLARETNPDKQQETHLTFTLLRYIEAPIPPPAKPAGDETNPAPANS